MVECSHSLLGGARTRVSWTTVMYLVVHRRLINCLWPWFSLVSRRLIRIAKSMNLMCSVSTGMLFRPWGLKERPCGPQGSITLCREQFGARCYLLPPVHEMRIRISEGLTQADSYIIVLRSGIPRCIRNFLDNQTRWVLRCGIPRRVRRNLLDDQTQWCSVVGKPKFHPQGSTFRKGGCSGNRV